MGGFFGLGSRDCGRGFRFRVEGLWGGVRRGAGGGGEGAAKS